MLKFDKVDLSDEEIDAIKSIIDDFDKEDLAVRERQIRQWKKLEFYWSGFRQIWWDAVGHDWRVYGSDRANEGDLNQSGYYDKNINVFRAYLETIIAALSQSVPPVKGLPDDVNNNLDMLTAKGATKIGELVYNHVDAPLLWIRALWTYCLQGMVAAYNYTDEDNEYGSVDIANEEDVEVEGEQSLCPLCGMMLGQKEIAASEAIEEEEEDEFDPGDDDIKMKDILNSGKLLCPQCMIDVDPELKRNKFVVKRLTGITNQPKSRQCIEINGGLYVKIPNWARSQKDCPYLKYSFETHYVNVLQKYPELEGQVDTLTGTSGATSMMYERWGRLSSQYRGEYPLNTPTENHWWLRPQAFESLQDEDIRKKLKKSFPDGCYVIMVNDLWVKACNQNLDDHWTLMFNPMSNSVHFDPIGELVVSIQDITTDLVSLELQCIEHSIPQTFASPKRLNFEQYSKTEVAPGMIFPTMPGNNKAIGEDFFTLQTATVSPELTPFGNKIGELGQFTSGALPALFGGTQNASSRTASQYAMQGNRAMQRLQIPWKMVNFFWKNIFAKVIPAYMKNMLEDERIVSEKNGKFVQTVIKRAELEGKLGNIKLEAPDGLPQSLDQIRETVMRFVESQNPVFMQAIMAPENLPIMQALFGINDLDLPGEKDREKQYDEIYQLLMSGPAGDRPTIEPVFEVDNHKIEAEICRNWLVGEEGRQAKLDNPEGYMNVLLHLKAHMAIIQQMMMPPAMPVNPGDGNKVQPPAGNDKLRPVPAGV